MNRKRLNFSLQANSKAREGASHPDRNPSSGYSNGYAVGTLASLAQFEPINAEVKAFQTAGQPAISVDTKKKEPVGDRRAKPEGMLQEWRP